MSLYRIGANLIRVSGGGGSWQTPSMAGGFPLARSALVSGSDKSAATGYIAPNGFCDNAGNNRQGGRIYPVTTIGRYWLRLEPLLGDTGARTVTANTFASTNTVSGTHFTAVSGAQVTFGDGEVGEKGIAIDILAIPTGFGLVGITLTGNAYRATCWLWLQGSGYVPGAIFMQTSNGSNAHGITTGAGTSISPYNSVEKAAAVLGNAGGVCYVKYNGSHKEFTSGVFGGNPAGQGIKLPNNCTDASPLIFLPDPANATPLLLDQGVTGAGGSSVLFSNATGFDWSGITGNSIWICGFNLKNCNYSTYNQTGGPAAGLVFWQTEVSYYSSDQSNAAAYRIDNTQSVIIQDGFAHNIYSSENGHNFNPFDSELAATYEGVHAFSPANASILHCKFDAVQYGCFLKDTGVTTSYDVSHCLFLRMAGGSTGGGNSGGPVAWPEQGGTANQGVMRYCAADRASFSLTIGHMWSCNGGGGTGSQASYVDVYNCTQIGLSGLANITQVDHVRVIDCISQSASLEDIKVNNAGSFVSSLLDANGNEYVLSTHGWNVNGTNYPNIAAWRAATLNAFLLAAPDVNSTTTSTPPSYPSTANHDYRVAITGGRRGGYIGVGLEQVTCVNNFLNSSLPLT